MVRILKASNLLKMTAILAVLCLRTAGAQVDEWKDAIDTDRPDQADSAGTVGAGRVQLETGLDRSTDPSTPAGILSLPLLLRIGVGDAWEARIATDGPQWVNPGGVGESWNGFQDLGLGVKWNFFHQEDKTLEGIGLIGEAGFQEQGSGMALEVLGLKLAMDLSFPGDLGLGVNLGMVQNDPSNSGPRDWAAASSFQFPISQRWSGYVEGMGTLLGSGDTTWGVGTGVKYLVTPDLQLDSAIRESFINGQAQMDLGLGCSIRIGDPSKGADPGEKKG